jgi:hypothetical protein
MHATGGVTFAGVVLAIGETLEAIRAYISGVSVRPAFEAFLVGIVSILIAAITWYWRLYSMARQTILKERLTTAFDDYECRLHEAHLILGTTSKERDELRDKVEWLSVPQVKFDHVRLVARDSERHYADGRTFRPLEARWQVTIRNSGASSKLHGWKGYVRIGGREYESDHVSISRSPDGLIHNNGDVNEVVRNCVNHALLIFDFFQLTLDDVQGKTPEFRFQALDHDIRVHPSEARCAEWMDINGNVIDIK